MVRSRETHSGLDMNRTATADVVFLLDVDNTLLDNDQIIADLQSHARDSVRYAPPFALDESDSDCVRPAVLAGETFRSSHAVSSTANRSPMCSTVKSAAGYRLALSGSRA